MAPSAGYKEFFPNAPRAARDKANEREREKSTKISEAADNDSKTEAPRRDGAKYHDADITDLAALVAVFEEARPDVVIHTASPAAQGATRSAHAIFKKVNVDGTQCVVDACRKTGVKALVYTSSASIMSDNQTDLINANEEYPVIRGKRQTEYYSETKVRMHLHRGGGGGGGQPARSSP